MLQAGPDNKSNMERLRGRTSHRERVVLGGCVHWLPPGHKNMHKLDTKISHGIYLRVEEESCDVMVGTDNGVSRNRTINRTHWDTRCPLPRRSTPSLGLGGKHTRTTMTIPSGQSYPHLPTASLTLSTRRLPQPILRPSMFHVLCEWQGLTWRSTAIPLVTKHVIPLSTDDHRRHILNAVDITYVTA